MSSDLFSYTGKGVKVAIVDDGICPQLVNIAGGAQIKLGYDGQIIYEANYLSDDPTSHGTICAVIIKRKAPDAQIYSVKVFGSEMRCDVRALTAAIHWAIKNEMNVVNLSLGTIGTDHLTLLWEACQLACDHRIIIVSATHNRGFVSYPAAFPQVIAVGKDDRYEGYDYTYHPDGCVQFAASGSERLSLFKPTKSAVVGTSIATARISAIVALILEQNPDADFQQVMDILIANASLGKPKWMGIRDDSSKVANHALSTRSPQGDRWSWIGKAALYPYDVPMHPLARFADMLSFEVAYAVDPVHSSLIGMDAGISFNAITNIPIVGSLREIENEVDTLILGYFDRFKETLKRDILKETLKWAIEKNKNVYSFSPIDPRLWQNLYKEAKARGLRIEYAKLPELDNRTVYSYVSGADINVPIIGIFGTAYRQGNFTTQIVLRKELIREGYKVCQVGTAPSSELFGFDVYFPNEIAPVTLWPKRQEMLYLEVLMSNLVKQREPDIVVVGCQGSVIPYELYKLIDADARDLPESYTLPAISFLLATKPDAYILVVNSIDPDEYIRDTMNVLKALGKGRVIAITFADKVKDIVRAYFHDSKWARQLSEDEIETIAASLQEKFGLPAICPVTPDGSRKLLEVVLEHFAEE